jgi:Protein of unknown function (DUF4238)
MSDVLRYPKKHHYIPVFYLKEWAGLGGCVNTVSLQEDDLQMA